MGAAGGGNLFRPQTALFSEEFGESRLQEPGSERRLLLVIFARFADRSPPRKSKTSWFRSATAARAKKAADPLSGDLPIPQSWL
jgi:hypothetical protein